MTTIRERNAKPPFLGWHPEYRAAEDDRRTLLVLADALAEAAAPWAEGCADCAHIEHEPWACPADCVCGSGKSDLLLRAALAEWRRLVG